MHKERLLSFYEVAFHFNNKFLIYRYKLNNHQKKINEIKNLRVNEVQTKHEKKILIKTNRPNVKIVKNGIGMERRRTT